MGWNGMDQWPRVEAQQPTTAAEQEEVRAGC